MPSAAQHNPGLCPSFVQLAHCNQVDNGFGVTLTNTIAEYGKVLVSLLVTTVIAITHWSCMHCLGKLRLMECKFPIEGMPLAQQLYVVRALFGTVVAHALQYVPVPMHCATVHTVPWGQSRA